MLPQAGLVGRVPKGCFLTSETLFLKSCQVGGKFASKQRNESIRTVMPVMSFLNFLVSVKYWRHVCKCHCCTSINRYDMIHMTLCCRKYCSLTAMKTYGMRESTADKSPVPAISALLHTPLCSRLWVQKENDAVSKLYFPRGQPEYCGVGVLFLRMS